MAESKRGAHGDERGPPGKRKFDEPPPEAPSRATYKSVPPPLSDFEMAKLKAEQIAARLVGDEFKRARTTDDHPHTSSIASSVHSSSHYGHPALEDRPPTDYHVKRVDVPNTKVGLVIGKGGETIRTLQQQSGAKIQVTRDSETDHGASTRQVELSGTSEQIARAEQLIRDVIGDGAHGGPSLGGGGGGGNSGEPIQIRVPNTKVGLIIGKGGETIKNLQQTSGARIQVQHDRETEPHATERIVTLSGSKEQIDNATEMIKEVIGERSRGGGGGYQQGYRPQQGYGYGYQQQQQQGYQQQQYGNYAGWEQQEQGSYDYYQNQSTDQQTENDGSYNYSQQEGYYYDPQAYGQQYSQQSYEQGGYGGEGQGQYNQDQEYAGGGYNYDYDPSYAYDQSGQYAPPPPAAAAAETEAAAPPGSDYEQPAQPPPASSAQPAHT